jgi:methylmalonyl-CoA/ethylmalonyl-CoA epimerase
MKKNYLKPHHVGISVGNMDESIAWYQKNLDFEFLWCKDFPPINTKIAFLQHGDFRVELFEHYNTNEIPPYRKHPLTDMQFQGTKHICFVMNSGLEDLFKQLKINEVKIMMGPMLSPPKDALMGFIQDNTGNLIEIIQLL